MNQGLFRVRFTVLTLIIISLFPTISLSAGLGTGDIPAGLSEWKAWVLHGKEKELCPTSHDNGADLRCQWPSRLQLSVNDQGGRFEQTWLMFAEDWVALPGNSTAWPRSVQVGKAYLPVVERNGTPSLSLPAGEHYVMGTFVWSKLPEMILVPPASGLVSLQINGQKIDVPELDREGRLWLQRQKDAGGGDEELLSVRVFRHLNDTIPMEITTRILLDVSGRPREIRLPDLLMDQNVPVRLDSVFPAKMAPDGALLCQVRPGQWDLRLVTRVLGPVSKLSCTGAYGPEIWSFQAQNHLRMVELTGAPAVEPERTDMPPEWKSLPAFGLSPEYELLFKELRRGDPDPAPDNLKLHRTCWLDFDGNGYTIQDTITGVMSRRWYLAMKAPTLLGRASIDGVDQMITRQGKEGLPGVALRKGNLNLSADSRLEGGWRDIPAVGWDQDFQQVSGELHLPPGWRLFAAQGTDSISGSWIQEWTLLDFFLGLIISLSIGKLRNWKWGLLALITMILIFREPAAPRLIWLSVIGSIALLKPLPQGWFRKTVLAWSIGSILVLLVIAIPFMAMQIRSGIFPQLGMEDTVGIYLPTSRKAVVFDAMVPAPAFQPESPIPATPQEKMMAGSRGVNVPHDKETKIQRQTVTTPEPNALIQTGPGLPAWRWEAHPYSWNGPVERSQTMKLWVLSPPVNLVLGILRALLLAILLVGLIDFRTLWPTVGKSTALPEEVAILAFLLLFTPRGEAAQADYPPPELLSELREHLLEKPDCLPQCAGLSRLALTADSENLTLQMELHAATGTAVPLPTMLTSWTPAQILLNGNPMPGLSRDNGGMLWGYIPEGVHDVVMTGKTLGSETLRLTLPLRPHVTAVDCRGWTVKGIRPDGSTDTTVELTRTLPPATPQTGFGNQALPPFFHVNRVFHLGLSWRVTTTVHRMSPLGIPVMLTFPLLPEESVITPGIHVEDKSARIAVAPNEETVEFESNLAVGEKIRLTAPTSVPWTETWVLDASPIWQLGFTGIPAIHHQDHLNNRQPHWAPWPGEMVEISISRPEAIPGKIMTIDFARLDWTPGLRFNQAELTLSIRASRGGQHEVVLPEGADLQTVMVNDRSLPIRKENGKITVPLQPGTQKVRAAWQQTDTSPFFIQPPPVTAGGEAVNAHISFHMPENGWILFAGGPRLGPAVLFWSYLGVVVLAAFGLRKIGWTPLKFHQWLLLGIGLTQVSPPTALLIAGWFPALGYRKEKAPPDRWLAFNSTQFILAVWTLAMLFGLYEAVERGLLGFPDMQISGNDSTRHLLQWTQDRINSVMPQPWVLMIPLWVYRIIMLVWSLWLALSLLAWMKWGWQCFSSVRLWKKAGSWKFRLNRGKPAPERPSASSGPIS